VKEASKYVIVQVNSNTPYVLGEGNKIHVSEVDAIVEADWKYDDYTAGEPDEISTQIAKHVLREIQDADTIQLGLGNISIAIGYGLKEFNDLGVYTELLAQPMYELMESGNVTNKYKGFMDGKTVFSFSFGSPDLYKALDHNPDYYVAPFPFVNDPRNIAKNRHMISINSTMSFNLFGEAAADCIGWKQQSGTGGQGDFVRGAQWSEGGKSIIATSSSFMKNGKRISKIVPYFAPGTAVTTPRSDIHYVATEFGCIDVRALTMQDRARAMISLAHPDFREELTSQAKAAGLI
ncbi:MAG: acetyl-CoA hydrolase, partial [Firmicutes bacterium]|nr:acetyl-CoA hydrolase [Bacillota bacterium]